MAAPDSPPRKARSNNPEPTLDSTLTLDMARSTTGKRAKLARDLAKPDTKSANRASLSAKVQHGELTPNQAEVETELLGLGKLAAASDPDMSIWQEHRVTDCQLPELIKPDGAGYMPLYCAAQWIATRGGTLEIDPSDLSVWQDAFAQLLPRLASEEIKVIGVRNGVTETVSALHFASCRVDYPYSDADFDLILSEELYLCSYPYIDDEYWRHGFDDSLRNRAGKPWERLMVLKSDVAHHWPFSLAQTTGKKPVTTYQSGAPGRPTSMHLVEVEFRARWDRGDAKTSIGAEAQMLSEWLQTKHPDAPQLTAKAIANRLRHEHRRRVTNAQK